MASPVNLDLELLKLQIEELQQKNAVLNEKVKEAQLRESLAVQKAQESEERLSFVRKTLAFTTMDQSQCQKKE